MFRLQQWSKQHFSRRIVSSAATLKRKPGSLNIQRNYASIKNSEQQPRVRYILYMIALSWAGVWFVSGRVDKKKPMQSMTESDFRKFEESTGIKRRHKLIGSDIKDKYKFYVIPYIYTENLLQKVEESLRKADPSRKNIVIDPVKLISQEKQDEGLRYSALLNELDALRKPYPPGLITAIIKEHIRFFINTREGTFETNFIIINYPQTTSEAIKFENDVGDIDKCLIMHFDTINELPQHKNDEQVRNIQNVDGYFDSVGKCQRMVSKFDIMDEKFEEIMLEDL
ncbi:AIM36 [Candida oxycetoniae]|uniref:AIM36 n=1 Tax=Candida oxycetoniae TaxID=497107 RepID=A0AAI9X0A7_9ASCO|nr:AIM36 [Candida oxycetoniae]KAI3406760.1 AIM36 [Candida oxycetoniae]